MFTEIKPGTSYQGKTQRKGKGIDSTQKFTLCGNIWNIFLTHVSQYREK